MTDKNIRPQIRDGGTKKEVRRKIGYQMRLDATKYQEKYPNKTVFWENDIDGRVQRWLDVGAEPVPSLDSESKIYEGLNDGHKTKWVTKHGGVNDDGKEFRVYLLMMDPEIYDEVKLKPQRDRQEEIHNAMRMGENQSGDALPSGIGTYAAYNADGSTGYNEIKPVVPDANKIYNGK